MSRTKPSTAGAEGGDLSVWCRKNYGSIRKAAKKLKVSAAHLSYISRGQRNVSDRIAAVIRSAGYGGAL